MNENERIQQFVKELTELSIKYGVTLKAVIRDERMTAAQGEVIMMRAVIEPAPVIGWQPPSQA